MPGKCHGRAKPVLILGEGSNVLFLKDYAGTVIVNRIMGIEVRKRLTPGIARWCRRKLASTGAVHATAWMPGLENLALIPGCAGSSPIQNIGAYGVELQRFANMSTASSWKRDVNSVFPRRNAVLAIVTVSLNMNIRIATPLSPLACAAKAWHRADLR
jgi:UDP-N-acetylenolpyruvoylglucosamine reductase